MKKILYILVPILLITTFVLTGFILHSYNKNNIRSHYTKTSKIFHITDDLVLEDTYIEKSLDEVRIEKEFVSQKDYYTHQSKVICSDKDFKEFYCNKLYLIIISQDSTAYIIDISKHELINTCKADLEFEKQYNLPSFQKHIIL